MAAKRGKHALQRRQPAPHVLPHPVVTGEQGEQLERNDRYAAKEELDDGRVRQGMPGYRFNILHLLLKGLAGKMVERRISNDGPDVPIDRKETRNTRAGHALRDAARRERLS